ncbi:hypothetical protein QBC35DRAFT_221904 [Podospora australis]|uniref:Uncharacterized protein n=1 Tax=Podospora australis TaxID=1536484 RepID=A0AAN7AMB5_9PEZI|nr:hypothetical protein QBC35DRAFT_221904 [Podospora australis]
MAWNGVGSGDSMTTSCSFLFTLACSTPGQFLSFFSSSLCCLQKVFSFSLRCLCLLLLSLQLSSYSFLSVIDEDLIPIFGFYHDDSHGGKGVLLTQWRKLGHNTHFTYAYRILGQLDGRIMPEFSLFYFSFTSSWGIFTGSIFGRSSFANRTLMETRGDEIEWSWTMTGNRGNDFTIGHKHSLSLTRKGMMTLRQTDILNVSFVFL